MKELRWVIKVKGTPCVVTSYKYKWAAKIHAFFLKIRYFGDWQFSITYEKTGV